MTGGVNLGTGSAMTLTPADCDAIRGECPAVRYAAPQVWCRQTQLVYGGRNWIPRNIRGTTASFLDIHNWTPLTGGEPFTDRDVRNAAKVCIIGQTLVRELFAGENPIGKDLRVGNVTFRVVGMLSGKGANMFGDDQDDILLAPWTTVKFRLSNQSGNSAGQQAAAQTAAASSATAVNTLSNLYPTASGQLRALTRPCRPSRPPTRPSRFGSATSTKSSAPQAVPPPSNGRSRRSPPCCTSGTTSARTWRTTSAWRAPPSSPTCSAPPPTAWPACC